MTSCSVAGYFVFGYIRDGNVLNLFKPYHDELMSLVRGNSLLPACNMAFEVVMIAAMRIALQVTLGFLFTIVFTFPMINFPMRICIHYWLHGETEATPLQHFLETAVPFITTLLISLFVRDVGVVFSLVGSVETCSTFFLFPAAMFLRSTRVLAIRQRTVNTVGSTVSVPAAADAVTSAQTVPSIVVSSDRENTNPLSRLEAEQRNWESAVAQLPTPPPWSIRAMQLVFVLGCLLLVLGVVSTIVDGAAGA